MSLLLPPFLLPIFHIIQILTFFYDSAITPANNVIVNEKWLNLVTEEHALDRTIGVITKTDRIEETGHQTVGSICPVFFFLMLT